MASISRRGSKASASPVACCISGTAYDHVRGRIDADFVDLGEEGVEEHRPAGAGPCGQDRSEQRCTPAPRASARERQGPPRLSIVVLPFANIGGDPNRTICRRSHREPDHRPFANQRERVIGRNTAFTYKDKSFDLNRSDGS